MRIKNKRFELRLTERELKALNRLAKKHGKPKSELIAGAIERAAKRQKVWE